MVTLVHESPWLQPQHELPACTVATACGQRHLEGKRCQVLASRMGFSEQNPKNWATGQPGNHSADSVTAVIRIDETSACGDLSVRVFSAFSSWTMADACSQPFPFRGSQRLPFCITGFFLRCSSLPPKLGHLYKPSSAVTRCCT